MSQVSEAQTFMSLCVLHLSSVSFDATDTPKERPTDMSSEFTPKGNGRILLLIPVLSVHNYRNFVNISAIKDSHPLNLCFRIQSFTSSG